MNLFIDTSAVASPRDYSEEKAKEIDEEVEHILEEAHKQVHEILSKKRQVLEDLYQLLMEKEVVEGEELRKILGKALPQPDKKQIPDTVPV